MAAPIVNTYGVISSNYTSATISGSITSALANTLTGSSAISDYGVVWSVTSGSNPTITVNTGKTSLGSFASPGSGSFNATLTGLNRRVYYARLYATNTSDGTIYGTETSVTAQPYGINPNPGLYSVPPGSNITGASKYNRVVSASATFTCTGSYSGVLALTTTGCTVSLTGGGSVVLGSITTPLELSVYQITAGSAYLYYR